MQFKQWVIRCGTFLAAASLLAAADAFVRPIPAKYVRPTEVATGSPDAPTTPVAHDAAWLQSKLDAGTAIVDARPLEEYIEGHVPGALHLPFEKFLEGRPQLLDVLDSTSQVIVYCGGGDCDASHKVEQQLANYGFKDIIVFEPGFPAWQSAGMAVEKGEPAL